MWVFPWNKKNKSLKFPSSLLTLYSNQLAVCGSAAAVTHPRGKPALAEMISRPQKPPAFLCFSDFILSCGLFRK